MENEHTTIGRVKGRIIELLSEEPDKDFQFADLEENITKDRLASRATVFKARDELVSEGIIITRESGKATLHRISKNVGNGETGMCFNTQNLILAESKRMLRILMDDFPSKYDVEHLYRAGLGEESMEMHYRVCATLDKCRTILTLIQAYEKSSGRLFDRPWEDDEIFSDCIEEWDGYIISLWVVFFASVIESLQPSD